MEIKPHSRKVTKKNWYHVKTRIKEAQAGPKISMTTKALKRTAIRKNKTKNSIIMGTCKRDLCLEINEKFNEMIVEIQYRCV